MLSTDFDLVRESAPINDESLGEEEDVKIISIS